MNERLEKEIDKRFEQAKVVGYMDGYGPVEISKEPFTRIARHFYNLALEDVKKEIERIRTNVYDCAKMRPAERQLGACMALDDIEDFINEQSK